MAGHPGGSGFIDALGGLRGVAAMSVLFSHLALHGYIPTFPAYGAGAVGVMLFFALSGFLMTNLYLPRRANPAAVAGFFRARFARVYPLYAVTIIVSGALTAAGIALLYPFTPEQVAGHLGFVQGERVFWTISVEFQFYALFALFWFSTRFLAQASDRTVALLLAGIYFALWVTGAPGERMSIVRNGQVFIAGMLIALVVRHAPNGGGWARLALPVGIGLLPIMSGASVLLWGTDPEPGYRSVPLHVGIALLIWSAVTAKGSAIAAFLGSKPLLALGEWSFGIYLLHSPVIWMGNRFAALLGLDRFWFIVPVVLAVLIIARRSYLSLEVPARKALGKRKSSPVAA